MEIPCQMCEKKLAKYACKVCGRQVCELHYNKRTNMCTGCSG